MMKIHIYRKVLLLCVILFCFSACLSTTGTAKPAPEDFPTNTITLPTVLVESKGPFTDGVAVMGDSMSDEYRADDDRGGDYESTTLNWVEQLHKTRNFNFGEPGTWGEPRRSGFEYNWARTGATSTSMVKSGQHTGVAQQVAEGKVKYVIIWIGGNDFHLKNGPYEDIYNGTLAGKALQDKIDRFITYVTMAADTVMAAGEVRMAVVTVADQGISKISESLYPDASKRQRVTDAVNAVNDGIRKLAAERNMIVIDINDLGYDIYNSADSSGYFTFGGEKISIVEKGDEPHHLQIDDNIGHAGTVMSGIIANKIFIEPFNEAYNLGLQPLSEDEILQNAGIK